MNNDALLTPALTLECMLEAMLLTSKTYQWDVDFRPQDDCDAKHASDSHMQGVTSSSAAGRRPRAAESFSLVEQLVRVQVIHSQAGL